MADSHGMYMRLAVVVVVIVVSGCHMRAGLDAASRTNGPLHTLMTQSTVSRQTGVLNLPQAGGHNYALEAGFGNHIYTVNASLAAHDVTGGSFTAGAGYLATTMGVNVRWSVLRWKNLTPTLAAGPARVMLLDRTTGERIWGNAIRFGGGAQYQLGPVAIYGDLYREVALFGGGPADGTTMLDGFTLGVALQPK